MSDDTTDAPADDSEETDDEQEMARDPFDSFDEYSERSGDPFDSLGDEHPADEHSADDGPKVPDEPSVSESAGDTDPFEYVEDTGTDPTREGNSGSDRSRPGTADSDPDPQIPESQGHDTAGDPLAEVDVSDGDPFESNASAFERSDVDGIDPDDVWNRLTADVGSEGNTDAKAESGEHGSTDEDDVVEVSKHSYCEGCEHFSPPPDVQCTHEGTEVLEFVDIDTVKIANCPVVEERRELEEDV